MWTICVSADLPLTLRVGLTKPQPIAPTMGQDKTTSGGAISRYWSEQAGPQQQ